MVRLILFFLFSSSAFGEDWWKVPRSEDPTYLYYVGVSEGKDGYEKTKDLSMSKAMGELIREHFGIIMQISESAVEELRKDSYQIVTRQSSAPLYLKGTSILKVHEVELSDGVIRVYTQVRVNKKDLQQAIDNQTKNGGDALATYGGPHDSQVDLTVKTAPSGAHISLTHLDRSYSVQGKGDALFYLPRGRYQMDVQLPGFVKQTQEITVDNPNGRIEVKLEQLYYDLSLSTTPEDSKVEVDGKVTTERGFRFASGKEIRIKVTHPDYYDEEIVYTKFDSEEATKRIRLQPKPSFLLLEVLPSGSSVTVDGVSNWPQSGKVKVGPGKHEIEVSHAGYFSKSCTIKVEPNKHYPIRKVKLEYDDPNLPKSDKGIAFRFEYNPFIYTQERGRFATIPFSLHLEMVYVSLGINYSGTQDHEESKNDYGEIDEKKQTRIQDTWGSLRIHTKSIGKLKFHLTGVAGSRKVTHKEWAPGSEISTIQRKSFVGAGGGIRLYVNPKWSIQAEYLRLNLKDKETQMKNLEDRLQVGIGYEF